MLPGADTPAHQNCLLLKDHNLIQHLMQGVLDEATQQGEANGMNGHAALGIQSTIPGFQVAYLSRLPFVTAV